MAGDPDNPGTTFHRARRAAARPGRLVVEVTGAGRLAGPARGLSRWLAAAAPARAAGAVTVVLVSDARMRALNRRYRGQDRVTDVLSFPAFAPQALRRGKPASAKASAGKSAPGLRSPASRLRQGSGGLAGLRAAASARQAEAQRAEAAGLLFLGDVVIAEGRARRQAAEAGHPLATELRVLALHGLLHLVGYDHERDGGRMGRVERTLRRRGGLREGLIERAGAPAPRRRRGPR